MYLSLVGMVTCVGFILPPSISAHLRTFISKATPILGKLCNSWVCEDARHEPRPKPTGDERNNIGMAERWQGFLKEGGGGRGEGEGEERTEGGRELK